MPQRVGGSEASTHDLAMALRARGHRIAVFASLDRTGLTWLRNRGLARLYNARFPADQWLPYRIYRGHMKHELERGLTEVAAEFKPDLIIVQAGQPMELARISIGLGLRTLVYLRDTQFEELGGPLIRKDGLNYVANSTFTASAYRRAFGIEVPVIPPLVCATSYRTRTRGRYVLFVNPVGVKGVNIAVAVARRLRHIPFVFLQSWPLWESASRELRKQLLPLANVRLQPQVGNMRPVYSGTRLLMVPSQWEETWGRVVTEAQFSGIPSVASNVGGLPESVGPGGILVDQYHCAEPWCDVIQELWHNPGALRSLNEAALAHSQREAIQPETLCRQLLAALP